MSDVLQIPATPEQIDRFLNSVIPAMEAAVGRTTDSDEAVAEYDVKWVRDFTWWFRYTLFIFSYEKIERQVAGISFALPDHLMPKFSAFSADEHELLFELISRPHLRVGIMPHYANVLVFRSVV